MCDPWKGNGVGAGATARDASFNGESSTSSFIRSETLDHGDAGLFIEDLIAGFTRTAHEPCFVG
jgi:hypothetical protein